MRLPPPWGVAALLLLLLALPHSWAQAPGSARESAVKAAFLYKFAGFIEWPTGTFRGPDDPLVVGVSGNDAVAGDLEQLAAGRTVDGRPVVVRRLREGDPVGAVHVLLVGSRSDDELREQAASVPGPVLLVTEQPEGLSLGGVLNFMNDGSRVRFSASLPAADARRLRLSARLLAVARHVEGRNR